jgi:hypothetical protein
VLEDVTTAALTTGFNTEVFVRTAGGGSTEGLTALEGQVGLRNLGGAIEERDSIAASDIFVAALVGTKRSIDDGRSATRSRC